MANHKEILRLKSLGLTHAQIAQSEYVAVVVHPRPGALYTLVAGN